jgi:hypothetical protein
MSVPEQGFDEERNCPHCCALHQKKEPIRRNFFGFYYLRTFFEHLLMVTSAHEGQYKKHQASRFRSVPIRLIRSQKPSRSRFAFLAKKATENRSKKENRRGVNLQQHH